MTLLEDTSYANVDLFFQSNTYSRWYSKGNFIVANSGEQKGVFIHHLTKKNQKIDLLDESKRKKLWLFVGVSCLDILEQQPGSRSGVYLIELWNRVQPVYCDMMTDGGGWTLFYANHGYNDIDAGAVYSFVEMRSLVNKWVVFNLYNYNNSHLSWLLDYRTFIENGDWSEILMVNRVSQQDKWLKAEFSSSETLRWALWEEVLWRTENGCLSLPIWESWSLINESETIIYEELYEIMNHRWVSWWISHSSYWCNDNFSSELAHIAFYNANSSNPDSRARSAQWIGWKWWWENEYRYFIR